MLHLNLETARRKDILNYMLAIDVSSIILSLARTTTGISADEMEDEKELALSRLDVAKGQDDQTISALNSAELDTVALLGDVISWVNAPELVAFKTFILRRYVEITLAELARNRRIIEKNSRWYLLKVVLSDTVVTLINRLDNELPLRKSVDDYKIEFLHRLIEMDQVVSDGHADEAQKVTIENIHEVLGFAQRIDWSSVEDLKKLQKLAISFTSTTDFKDR